MKKNARGQLLKQLTMVTIFLVGLLVMSYPFYVNAINSYWDQYQLSKLQKEEKTKFEEQKKKLLEENKKMTEKGLTPGADPFTDETINPASKKEIKKHWIGSVKIPKLSVEIPLFDTTTSALLEVGATVLNGTSFPLGGASTHSAITAHRGLPTRELFSDLPNLKAGDLFVLEVLGEKLAYEVDDQVIVTPDDTSHLKIVPGADLVTLITCTPYMINSHRLLVTGHRIEYTEEVKAKVAKGKQASYLKQGLILLGTVIGVGLFIFMIQRTIYHYRLQKYRFSGQFTLVSQLGEPLQESLVLYNVRGKKPLSRGGKPFILSPDDRGILQIDDLPGGKYALKMQKKTLLILGKEKIKEPPQIIRVLDEQWQVAQADFQESRKVN